MTTVSKYSIKAFLEVLPTHFGGRRTSIHNGYRPQFYYKGRDWDCRFVNLKEPIKPGDREEVYLQFLSPHLHKDQIYTGMPFLLREGNHIVAFGSSKSEF